ncbi:hypothetical protein JVV04_20250, partial [Vibrio cholerae O1]|nr:hypothetical protein [Vibrio cholerae O1]
EEFTTYGRSPDGAFTFPAYAAIQIIADTLNAVGDDASKGADHMHSNSFDTAIGAVAYDEKGDLKQFEFSVYKWDKENGFS